MTPGAATGGGWAAIFNESKKASLIDDDEETSLPEPEDPRQTLNWESFVKNRDKVTTLQVYLNRYEPKFYLKEDGRWGGKTEKALKRWQFENDYEPTGVLDDEQWQELYDMAEGGDGDIPESEDALPLQ